MSFLTRVSSVRLLRRAFTRVINIESIPAFDKYEHMSNMKSEDLFEFEPFSKEDLIVDAFVGDLGCRRFLESNLERIMT